MTVRRSPGMLAEAMEAYTHMQKLCGPMDRETVYAELQEMILHYGPPKFDGDIVGADSAAGLANAWLDSWTRLLRGTTREGLRAAVTDWLRRGDNGKSYGWPKPMDLIKRAEKVSLHQRMLLYRLKVTCETAPTYKPPPSAEEQAKVREMLADFQAQAKARPRVNVMADAYVPRPENPEIVQDLVRSGLRGPPA